MCEEIIQVAHHWALIVVVISDLCLNPMGRVWTCRALSPRHGRCGGRGPVCWWCCVVLCALWCCVMMVLCALWCYVLCCAECYVLCGTLWCFVLLCGAPNYPQLPHFRSHCAHTPRHKISVSIFISHKISAKHAICAVEDTGVQREHPLKSAAAISICLTSFIPQTMFSWSALDVKNECEIGTQSNTSMWVVSVNGPRYPPNPL